MLQPTPDDRIRDMRLPCLSQSGKPYVVPVRAYSLTRRLRREGILQERLAGIVCLSADGFAVTLPQCILARRELFVVLARKGVTLRLPTVAAPGERAVYWAKNVAELRFLPPETRVAPKTVHIFRTGALTPHALTYKRQTVIAWSVREICARIVGALPGLPVTLLGYDGYAKREMPDTFLENYVTLQTESAPLYFSETLARGMRMKGLMAFVYESSAVYFARDEQPFCDLLTAVGREVSRVTVRCAGGDAHALRRPDRAVLLPHAARTGEVDLRTEEGLLRGVTAVEGDA